MKKAGATGGKEPMTMRRFSFQEMQENAGVSRMREGKGWRRRALFLCTIFGEAFCIAVLYQAMRGVMRLGGMVAAGGPYAIAHPAPSWVWVLPVSIFVGMACFFINMFSSRSAEVNLMPLAWPGLFLSAGWNFLEFAFHPPGGGFSWGWLVCGVVFALMGGLPLYLAFRSMRERIRLRQQRGEGLGPYAGQWLLVGAGVWLAIVFFRSIAA